MLNYRIRLAQHTNGSNDVGEDVVLGTLLRERLSETDLAEFGGYSCQLMQSRFIPWVSPA
jgi:hypothetical protein